MRQLLLLALSIVFISMNAQPTITESAILPIGTVLKATYNEGPLSIDNNGANQTWIFPENLNTETFNTNLSIIDSDDAPFSELFPDAMFSILNEDIFVYSHYKIENNQLISLGYDLGDDSFGGLTYTTSTPGEAILKWPLTYLEEWNTESMIVDYITGTKIGMGTRNYSAKATGYGNVETPNGLYENVLKIEVDYVNQGYPIDQILFFHPTSMIPLVSVDIYGDGDFGYTYIDIKSLPTSSEDLYFHENIKAYYTNGEIHLKHNKNLTIKDITLTNGKSAVIPFSSSQNEQLTILKLNNNIAPGIYYVSAILKNKRYSAKIFIP